MKTQNIMIQAFFICLMTFSIIGCAGDGAEASGGANVDNVADASASNYDIKSNITEKKNKVPSTAEMPKIIFNVDGLTKQPVYMIGMYTDQRFRADSTSCDNKGRFVFERDRPFDAGLYYAVFSDNSFAQFLVSNDQTFTMTTTKENLVKNMKVKGSLDNQLLYDDLRFQESLKPKYAAISKDQKGLKKKSKEYKALNRKKEDLNEDKRLRLNAQFKEYPKTFYTAFKRAGQNPKLRRVKGPDGKLDEVAQVVRYRNEFWDGVDFSDERLLYTPVVKNKLERYITELTPQNPDSIKSSVDKLIARIPRNDPENKFYSYFVNWIGLKYEPGKSKLMDSEAVYVHMVQQYYNYDRAFWADSAQIYALQLRAHEMAGSLIGNDAPDVRAKNPNGKFKSIGEITADYIVVYMYNPQCEHCAIETPKLVKWYNEWKSKGVEVFAIAIDTDAEEWKGYVKKNKMNFINVYDPSNQSIYAKYYVNVTPELYLINPDRKIIGKNLKVGQIETVMNRDKEKRAIN